MRSGSMSGAVSGSARAMSSACVSCLARHLYGHEKGSHVVHIVAGMREGQDDKAVAGEFRCQFMQGKA